MSGGPCGSIPAAAIPSTIRGAKASKSARDSQKSMIPQPPSIGPEAWKSSPFGGVRSGSKTHHGESRIPRLIKR